MTNWRSHVLVNSSRSAAYYNLGAFSQSVRRGITNATHRSGNILCRVNSWLNMLFSIGNLVVAVHFSQSLWVISQAEDCSSSPCQGTGISGFPPFRQLANLRFATHEVPRHLTAGCGTQLMHLKMGHRGVHVPASPSAYGRGKISALVVGFSVT